MQQLVTTQWLADALTDIASANLVILDASAHLPDAGRDAAAEFLAAHIPHARHLDLKTFVDPANPVPASLPTPAQFSQRMGALGITPATQIILYDDSYVKTAARAWFICRLHGHAKVAILDGGLGKWRAEGRPVEGGEAASSPTAFPTPAGQHLEVRNKADVLANLESAAELLVDARGAGRFTGEEKDFRPEVAAGHIPGSRNLPFDRLFNPDGTYKDEAALRAAFAEAGVDLSRPLVTTCGGGVTAAVVLFAAGLIGKHDVALYDGSWAEWGVDPATPKATGPAV